MTEAVSGQIVVLNGAPRSGKSSIASQIQETWDGTWINLGVDVARAMTPPRAQPGIGLRPGASSHPATSVVPLLYSALWESIAAHSRLGLNVVSDLGLYDASVAVDAACRLTGLPVLFVGVRCPVEVVMERRRSAPAAHYATAQPDAAVPEPVLRWQHDTHAQWAYDLDVDTSAATAADCAAAIARRLASPPPPSAFARLATFRA